MRLDALVRYAQDVSNDDTTDAALDDDLSWIVRRTTIDVVHEAVFGESLRFSTFCSGLGSRWAERRLQIVGDRGAHVEMATLWVYLDAGTGRPRRLTEQFVALYGPAAQGRTVRARLEHGDPPSGVSPQPWPVRFVDFDVVGHMNNAAYWVAVEEVLAVGDHPTVGIRAELEYGRGVDPEQAVSLLVVPGRRARPDGAGEPAGALAGGEGVVSLWWTTETAPAAASAVVRLLPRGWYHPAPAEVRPPGWA